MKLSNLKVSYRLALGFGAVVLLSMLSAGISLSKLASVQANLEDVVKDNNVKIQINNDMLKAVHVVSRVVRTIVLLPEKADMDREMIKITEARDSYNKNWQALQKFPSSPAGQQMRDKIKDLREQALPLNNKVLELGFANKTVEATAALLQEAGPATTRWLEAIEANVNFQEAQNIKQYDEAVASYLQARNLLIGIGVLSAALAALLGWLITRSITRQLGAEPGEAAALAQAVAEGDFSIDIALRPGDSGSLMAQLKLMQESLSKVVSTVRTSAEGVSVASAQIAEGNNDLSQRTEEQASALEQTAASMEELSSSVKQNADNAKQANQLAISASSVAVDGGAVVGQVVETMKGINDSSKKIADIISVIDGIAFQTNILALNAAVEAARAGEQGRGFAVVASEVRSLAQRSAAAAKEIKELITTSVERVSQGTQLVDHAGQKMSEIVGSIKRVTDIMGEISAASNEQASGVAQVGEAVMQMDQTTQGNAALVEESAAAAESLRQQALQLVETVAVFKLSRTADQQAHTSPLTSDAVVASAERRSPSRAKNVIRPVFQKTAPKSVSTAATAGAQKPTGTDDAWASF